LALTNKNDNFSKNIINAGSGSGTILQTGFETTIDGAAFSIQRLDVYVKLGKII